MSQQRPPGMQSAVLIFGCVALFLLPIALLALIVWNAQHPAPARPVHHKGFRLETRELPPDVSWPFAQRLTDRPGLQLVTPWDEGQPRRLLVFEPAGEDPLHLTHTYDLPGSLLPFDIAGDGRLLGYNLDDDRQVTDPAAPFRLKLRWSQPDGTPQVGDPGYDFTLSRANHRVGVLVLEDGEAAFLENKPLDDGTLHLWLERPGEAARDIQKIANAYAVGPAWYDGGSTLTVLSLDGNFYVLDRKQRRMTARHELGYLALRTLTAAQHPSALALCDGLAAAVDLNTMRVYLLSNSGGLMELQIQDPRQFGADGKLRLLPFALSVPTSGDRASQLTAMADTWRKEGRLLAADRVGGTNSQNDGWSVRILPTGPGSLTLVDYCYARAVMISATPAS